MSQKNNCRGQDSISQWCYAKTDPALMFLRNFSVRTLPCTSPPAPPRQDPVLHLPLSGILYNRIKSRRFNICGQHVRPECDLVKWWDPHPHPHPHPICDTLLCERTKQSCGEKAAGHVHEINFQASRPKRTKDETRLPGQRQARRKGERGSF